MIKFIIQRLSLIGTVPLCNLNESRGLFIGGFCLPLCARCTAIIFTFLLTVFILLFKKIRFKRRWIIVWALCLLPCLIDGVLQYAFNIESTNLRRIITGAICGFGIAHLLSHFVNFINAKIK